ncbi:hypothetical protein D8674_017423 [Pyrus ussuriensis x Pyrus communis]|uniref:Uncharacterized protein n=1 Tax=Pyrus ussuriensis x Pyrus communis TaxID=2448454 RepID=A0A5N5HGN8_9ROSA|nr:hypothetical protein D8674_017423 [Pyrus ussuriensis x Pyrus communis]
MYQHPEDKYKLDLLYFAHFVVLGKENESAIDYHLLQLVENEEKWERCPWRIASFQMLMPSKFATTLTCHKIWLFETLSYLRSKNYVKVVVHPITPTEEEKMVLYWNVMFDDVNAGRDATPEDESKGVADADYDSEGTPSSKSKGKAKKGYTYVGALPSSSRDNGSPVVETLEKEQCARMKLAAELEHEVTEVSEHSIDTDEGADMNEATGSSSSETIPCKGIWLKRKGMQLVYPFTLLGSYKRRKVGDGCSVDDFIVLLEPMRIISKPDVEVFVDVLTRWVG